MGVCVAHEPAYLNYNYLEALTSSGELVVDVEYPITLNGRDWTWLLSVALVSLEDGYWVEKNFQYPCGGSCVVTARETMERVISGLVSGIVDGEGWG